MIRTLLLHRKFLLGDDTPFKRCAWLNMRKIGVLAHTDWIFMIKWNTISSLSKYYKQIQKHLKFRCGSQVTVIDYQGRHSRVCSKKHKDPYFKILKMQAGHHKKASVIFISDSDFFGTRYRVVKAPIISARIIGALDFSTFLHYRHHEKKTKKKKYRAFCFVF